MSIGLAAVLLADILALTPVPQDSNPDGWWMKRHSEKGCDRTFALPKAMKGEKKFSGVLLPEEQPLELLPAEGRIRVALAAGQGFCVFCPNK